MAPAPIKSIGTGVFAVFLGSLLLATVVTAVWGITYSSGIAKAYDPYCEVNPGECVATATPKPPTATPKPPTATPRPPTPTQRPDQQPCDQWPPPSWCPQPTPRPTRTPTPVPPTATPTPPEQSCDGDPYQPHCPQPTPVPPTKTPTPIPPTATPVPPTATPVPPTATPIPPTATPRPPPPPTVPGRVGTPSVSAVSGSYSELRVRWSRPYSGRASITGYQVRYYDPAPPAQWFSANTTSRDYTIGGLEGGTSYSVQVRAKNRVGWGSWSRSGSARVNVRPTPEPTATDTPTPVPDTPTPEPTATDTPVPESTPELEPTPEASPETTPTPAPAPTPEPGNRPSAPYQVEWSWKNQGTYAQTAITLTWRTILKLRTSE